MILFLAIIIDLSRNALKREKKFFLKFFLKFFKERERKGRGNICECERVCANKKIL